MGKVSAKQGDQLRQLLVYEAPVLRILGDVRQLTLGGSPGAGDSGNPGSQQNPPPPGGDNDPIWR